MATMKKSTSVIRFFDTHRWLLSDPRFEKEAHLQLGIAYQTFTGGVTSVFGPNNAKRPSRGVSEAAGQGLEPQLPEPESGVLPLDDPAGRRADCSRPGGSDLEPVLRDEALLGIGVDVRDHLDVRLEPRPSQLRPQQPVDLEEA